ncbi:NADP-dependent oxidoreductase [Bacterioplanes sanyensis]|nr:NADP-dependent oxidoreductase [Bacterioplanes sanyensis]
MSTNNTENTMIAAYIEGYGQQQPLVIGQLPTPKPAANEVLIEVKAAGVNPVDFHIRNGMIADTGAHTLPLILGWDAAGTVVAKGEQVSQHAIGDEVFVFAPIDRQGSYAGFISVDASLVAPKPRSLTALESAGVPLAAVTAWQGLVQDGQLSAGQSVLILGASGGVGGFAVQIAKSLGAQVIASASGKNAAYVKSLGADEFIDYKTTDFAEVVKEVDLVFVISSGGDLVKRAFKVVKSCGHVVSTLDDVEAEFVAQHDVHFSRMWVQPSGSDLARIGELIDQGDIQVHLDSVYSLRRINDAIQRSEAQLAVGKIVIDMTAD